MDNDKVAYALVLFNCILVTIATKIIKDSDVPNSFLLITRGIFLSALSLIISFFTGRMKLIPERNIIFRNILAQIAQCLMYISLKKISLVCVHLIGNMGPVFVLVLNYFING